MPSERRTASRPGDKSSRRKRLSSGRKEICCHVVSVGGMRTASTTCSRPLHAMMSGARMLATLSASVAGSGWPVMATARSVPASGRTSTSRLKMFTGVPTGRKAGAMTVRRIWPRKRSYAK